MTATDQLLFQGADWDFRTLQRICDACEQVAPRLAPLDPDNQPVAIGDGLSDARSWRES